MNYEEPDPYAWDDRDDEERCPRCSAHRDDPCEADCACGSCEHRRLRELDVDPEGEAA